VPRNQKGRPHVKVRCGMPRPMRRPKATPNADCDGRSRIAESRSPIRMPASVIGIGLLACPPQRKNRDSATCLPCADAGRWRGSFALGQASKTAAPLATRASRGRPARLHSPSPSPSPSRTPTPNLRSASESDVGLRARTSESESALPSRLRIPDRCCRAAHAKARTRPY
jgi:hypothetical protein